MMFWIIILVIIGIYWLSSNEKKKTSFQQPKIVATSVYSELDGDKFEEILKKYKDSIDSPELGAKDIERLANEFELKFRLRSLFDFFFFIQSNTNIYNGIEISRWWDSKLLPLARLEIKNSHGNCEIQINLMENKIL